MAKHYTVKSRIDFPVPMRDGIKLSTDLYLPAAPGEFPAILIRTPYSNNAESLVAKGRQFAAMGYACVIQDCRGRWDSEGQFNALQGEAEDGFDTLEWVANQGWCNGRVGTYGGSYLGEVQWAAVSTASPHLFCIAPAIIGSDAYNGFHPGGAMLLNTALTWSFGADGRTAQNITSENWTEVFRTLPISQAAALHGRDIPFLSEWLSHPARDSYWDQIDYRLGRDAMQIPALITTGWYDLFLPQTLSDYQALIRADASDASRQSQLVVGPWTHGGVSGVNSQVGELDFGFQSLFDMDSFHLRWFSRWLQTGDALPPAYQGPRVKLFVMGKNEWRDEQEWPLARAVEQRWFLHSEGSANTVAGDGILSLDPPANESADHFVYNPEFPVQTIGGANCCNPAILPWGPYDQRAAEMRNDVLCYSSMPMEHDLEVTGPITAIIFAATDAVDTDWTVKLIDVWQSGYAMLLSDGIIRARFRENQRNPQLLEPGKVYRYEIPVQATSNVFLKGHQIRVEISSSNFPRFDRNLNTGKDSNAPEMCVAKQRIYHDRLQASYIQLPVIAP